MTFALLAGIVASGALGSVHCAAMCGPLVAIAGGTRSPQLAIAHAFGRLATYLGLGAAAGLVGRAVDVAGELVDAQRLALVVASGAIVAWGGYALATALGWRHDAARPTGRWFGHALVKIRSRSAVRRAAVIGVLAGLLPCGWLWAFVITAAGAGSATAGAVVMLAFWIGTVPMVALLAVAGPALAGLRARLPVITAVALLALGLGMLASRWQGLGIPPSPHGCHHCAGAM